MPRWRRILLSASLLLFFMISSCSQQRELGETAWLAFTSDQRGNLEVFVINVDGYQIRLTHSLASDQFPTWSPNGDWIAFTSYRDVSQTRQEIFLTSPDGAAQRQLTDVSAETNISYEWSPDGKWIAFSYNVFTSPQGRDYSAFEIPTRMIVISNGGDEVRELASVHAWNPYVPLSMRWSPDGQWIAYEATTTGRDVSRNVDIFLARPDGLDPSQLSYHPLDDRLISWSPDGRWIAFYLRRNEYDDEWGLRIIRPDGSDETKLTGQDELAGRLSWSHDGQWVAFTARPATADASEAANSAIFVMRAGSAERIQLSGDSVLNNSAIAWSPDDQWIAFTSNQDGDGEVLVVRPHGPEQKQLTSNSQKDGGCLAWSPDGEWIAFSSDRDGDDEIFVMRPDGSHQTHLTEDWGGWGCPEWSPHPWSP